MPEADPLRPTAENEFDTWASRAADEQVQALSSLPQAAAAYAAEHPEAQSDHDAALAELAAAREAAGPEWPYWLAETDWDREVDIEDWHTPWPRGLEAQAASAPEAEAEAEPEAEPEVFLWGSCSGTGIWPSR